MHKNIIFDCGRVLLLWSPELLASLYTNNKEDEKIFLDVVFKYWSILDSGDFTYDDLLVLLKDKLPDRLLPQVKQMTMHWYEDLPEIEKMREVVDALKKSHKVYLLSNIPLDAREHLLNREILQGFDGYLLSGEEHLVKPYTPIFNRMLEKYNLKAQDCLFIDDSDINIYSSKKVGMDGFVFDYTNVEALVNYLKENNDL